MKGMAITAKVVIIANKNAGIFNLNRQSMLIGRDIYRPLYYHCFIKFL